MRIRCWYHPMLGCFRMVFGMARRRPPHPDRVRGTASVPEPEPALVQVKEMALVQAVAGTLVAVISTPAAVDPAVAAVAPTTTRSSAVRTLLPKLGFFQSLNRSTPKKRARIKS